jgi:hypothetical protein
MMLADEAMRAGDDVAIVFDGAGLTALAAMLDPASDLHRVWTKAARALRGVCGYCSKYYGFADQLIAADIPC